MGLREYRQKRDFSRTPEPEGAPESSRRGRTEHPSAANDVGKAPVADAPAPGRARSFVVQEHAASHLHYDFRLELEGVLKSWAVPKGPSLDPMTKRLAMATEDHPLEYGDFEGVIPKGEYGGGTVLLWDRGAWVPRDNPHEGWRRGHLGFELFGHKLRGSWTLVKTASRDDRSGRDNAWLLMKDRDQEARPPEAVSILEERPESVETGRSMNEIAAAADRVWHSNRTAAEQERPAARQARAPRTRPAPARKTPRLPEIDGARPAELPDRVQPELPTLVKAAPEGDRWLHEMKLDGYRIVSFLDRGRVRMHSRRGEDWTHRFGPIASAIAALPVERAVLDGEVAVLMPDGTTSFSALLEALSAGAGERLVYYLFDLLHLDGQDLTPARLEGRKKVLEALVGGDKTGPLRYSAHVIGSGERFYQHACRLALEGTVAKRRDAPYRQGRSRDWVKVKCVARQEFVIGGFSRPTGSPRAGLRSLLVGVRDDDGELVYVGRVGSGFTEKTRAELSRRLAELRVSESPFQNEVTGPKKREIVWVEPTLVADIDFSEWTADDKLRHPRFRGLREDKTAAEAKRERPARSGEPRRAKASSHPRGGTTAEVAGVKITHADRLVYPEEGLTKLDLARFYVDIQAWILPQLAGRPTTLVRCPDGLGGPCFYQKHRGYWAPDSLRRVRIQEKTKVGEYLVVDDLAGLVGLSQIGILEIHTWNSTAEHLEQPDRIVFDLDPDEALPFSAVVEAARVIQERLEGDGLQSFVKTTGGKGLHLVVPIVRGPSWDDCASYARGLAEELAGDDPGRFVAVMTKARRRGKVYIDWLRNVRGATSVAAYSTRAKAHAPLSVPLDWSELSPRMSPDRFQVKNIRKRLDALDGDPWAGYAELYQRLPRRGR